MSESQDPFADVDENGGIEGYEPRFVDVDGTRTRYYDIGEGEPLVLVHGGNWSGLSSANTWTSAFDPLKDHFRVLAFDRIGCGMTDNPDDVEAYRYRTELDHAIGFIEAMGFDSCHIAGSSRGGGLATRMAVERPELFDTLVILNSGTLGPAAGDKSFRYDRLFERGAPDVDPTDPESIRYRLIQYSHQIDNITDEMCRASAYMRSLPKAVETAEIMEERGHQEAWEETMQEHMDEAHRRIKDGVLTIPTLYLYGRNDLSVRLEMGIAAFDLIAQQNPKVRLNLINHCGHLIYRERPEEFARSIVDFVDFWH